MTPQRLLGIIARGPARMDNPFPSKDMLMLRSIYRDVRRYLDNDTAAGWDEVLRDDSDEDVVPDAP